MKLSPNLRLSERSTLLSATTVVVANHFNLSIFQPFWFVRNGILREDELSQNVLISAGVVVVPTANFVLTLLAERAQFQILPPAYETATEEIDRVVGGIARTLPHTPYAGVGFNFDCTLETPPETAFPQWDRENFSAECVSRIPGAEATNARFGAYVSCDVLGSRLKLNVLPAKTQQTTPTEVSTAEHMLLSFNYHTDVPQPAETNFVLRTLKNWDGVFDHLQSAIAAIK